MFIDKSLRIALLVSALFHMPFFLPLPYLKNSFVEEPAPPIITYLAPKEILAEQIQQKEEPVTKVTKALLKPKKEDPPAGAETKRIVQAAKPKDEPVKKVASLPHAFSEKDKIEIPPELPKEKEALYLDYYQAIRQKIKRYVVRNYPRFISCGEVCLYFVLSSKGQLEQVHIVEERSTPQRLLKEIAKKSVHQASPFLPFPKELSQGKLSFNVIISFELEN